MFRVAHVVRRVLVIAIVLVGSISLIPAADHASAYPTALANYDAPTAKSFDCTWSWSCMHGGESDYCVPSEDPFEGCQYTNYQQTRCLGCYI